MKLLSHILLVAGALTVTAWAQTTPPAVVITEQAQPAPTAEPTTDKPGRKPNYFTSKDPAPGGARNLVWANSHTKRYHCFGTKYYGRTYQGSYVDETEAIEDGYRPSNRTGCSK